MDLSVLGSGNVGSKNGSGLECNVNEQLEDVDGVVLNAAALEESSLLAVVHGQVTA